MKVNSSSRYGAIVFFAGSSDAMKVTSRLLEDIICCSVGQEGDGSVVAGGT